MSTYQLDAAALLDLEDILSYTEARRSEDAAYVLEGEFLEAFDRLAAMPGLGHSRPDLTSRPQLFYLQHPYLIVYARGTDPLRIIAILHSARNLRRLLISRQKAI